MLLFVQVDQLLSSYDSFREQRNDAYFLLADFGGSISVHPLDQFESIHRTADTVLDCIDCI